MSSSLSPQIPASPIGRQNRLLVETRAAQLDEMMRLVKFTAIPQVMIAATLLSFFWDSAHRGYVEILFAAVSAPATAAAFAARLWQGSSLSTAATSLGHLGSIVLAGLAGVAWASMPAVLFSTQPDTHEALVVATVAGLISIVYVLGPILAASIMFVAPIVLVTLVSVLVDGGPDTGALAFLLLIYSFFTVVCRTLMNGLSIQRLKHEIGLREQKETIGLLLRDFEENASDWLWETDRHGRLVHLSQRMVEASIMRPDELHRASFRSIFADGEVLSAGADEVLSAMDQRQPFVDRLVQIGPTNGSVWWKLSGKPIFGHRGFAGYRGVGADVTSSRNSELRIAHMAAHDHLTGLSNRPSFQALTERLCADIRSGGGQAALLYVDLDGFKAVNDDCGHPVGDAVLASTASRMVAILPSTAVVARLGGDEFSIWLPQSDRAPAEAFAAELIHTLSQPFSVSGRTVTISASIGIALVPDHATEVEALHLRADLALLDAKSHGKKGYRIFDPRLEQAMVARRALEADLSKALIQNEFELVYQPIVDLGTGQIQSFEALIRWRSPSRGLVLPDLFVSVAEECGLIAGIGRWVLREACRQAATWPADTYVAVNVSPKQLAADDFMQEVVDALAASQLPGSKLEVEITEGLFVEATGATLAKLVDLRKLGVKIAIDDFGTGFSSLGYLVKFAVDKIKIDRSFICEFVTGKESRIVVEAILALSKRFGMTVTAEGVETTDQAALLQVLECETAQGYLFSRPVGREQAHALARLVPAGLGSWMAHEQAKIAS